MKGAMFVGWGPLIPGREEAAREVLGEAMGYLHRLQQDGVIDGFEAVALEPHGGKLNGFVLVKGELEAISKIRTSEEFTRIAVRVQIVHSNVTVVGAYTGAEMGALFGMWDEEEARLLR